MTTVTPQELGAILDVAAKANLPFGQAYQLTPILSKLVALANQKHPIGAMVPETGVPEIMATTESPFPLTP